MTESNNARELIQKLENEFGGRSGVLFHMLQTLALSGQPCDICTHSGKRFLDVKINDDFVKALMYGAGAEKLAEMLNIITLKGENGGIVAFKDIWVINPMPNGGLSEEDLASVDLSEGENNAGPNGETVRQMIKETYHCKDENEIERFLRRFLAS